MARNPNLADLARYDGILDRRRGSLARIYSELAGDA